MRYEANNEFLVKLAKHLGMTVTDKDVTCTGRKGIVYIKIGGEVVPLASRQDGRVFVCACEHDAVRLVQQAYKALLLESMRAILKGDEPPDIPDAGDFTYVYADEAEDTAQDVTPEAKAEADAFIEKLTGAKA